MLLPGPIKTFTAEVAALVHADRKRDAALYVADFCKLELNLDGHDPKKYMPVLANWLHWLLNNNAPEEAAQLLWTPNKFTPEPQCTRDIWKLFQETAQGLIMGAGSMGKSYGMGVRLFLEWVRDPDYTTVKVVGPTKAHLEQNLFSHLVDLHASASLPMPGTIGELFIGANRRNQLGSIHGTVIPLGQVKKSARIQGSKRKNRAKPHPIFGPLSRMFLFVDEIERVPAGIWQDVSNILTQISAEGVDGFKIFAAYNPTDQSDEVAKRAEPPFGWENLDADKHFRWKSRRGWDVLRLDGERSENVLAGKTIYVNLQTRAGLEAIALDAGGRDSGKYLSQGRGMYPVQGIKTTVIPPGMFSKWRGEFIWLDEPVSVSSCDLALEGSAAARYTLGKWGLATGMKLPPDLQNPNGRTVMFKDKFGSVQPRYGLLAESQHTLPRAETVERSRGLIDLNRKAGVKPRWFAMDRTGNGAGTADLIKNEWGGDIHDVNFSEAPSEGKLMLEDTKTCAEEYDRLCAELWFALRCWGEYGYLLISPAMDISELTQQVTQRLQKLGSSKKSQVESKKDYISRGFVSPDSADSLCLFVHAARKGSGEVLSRYGHSGSESAGDDGDQWYDGGMQFKIDASNRTDFLYDTN